MTQTEASGDPKPTPTGVAATHAPAYDPGDVPTVTPTEHFEGKAANETLEDYTLRFAPRSYRRWGTGVVATSALGGIAYLADFAIGANIGIANGTTNALWGIAIAAVIIFVTGFPLAYYAARYNIDLDLITRGSGFGYYGSVLTNVIFATFTFIFFALEGSIMAQGLQLGLGIPLWAGYAVSTLMVIPLVIFGMKALAKLQVWTTPLWLILFVIPMAYLLISHPDSVETFFAYQGADGDGAPSFAAMMLAAGVCLSLMAQIAEQIDYLRFMPPRTDANRKSWWRAVILAGPGWVIFGAVKQVVGLFVAVYIIAKLTPESAATANEPVHQFLTVYQQFLPEWAAMTLAVFLVVISQIKINVTNAYSGSLAWTNSFTRVTKHYPGRLVFVIFNVSVALLLMELNMFSVLNTILGFYANCAMAWVVTVAADIVINKGSAEDLAHGAGVPQGHAVRVQPGRFRVGDPVRGPVDHGVLRVVRRMDPTVLADRGHPVGPGPHSRCWPSSPRASTTCAATTTASRCRCSTRTATRPARPSPATSATRTTSGRT